MIPQHSKMLSVCSPQCSRHGRPRESERPLLRYREVPERYLVLVWRGVNRAEEVPARISFLGRIWQFLCGCPSEESTGILA